MNTLFSPVRPCALVICGVPASGKSTLAAAVSASLGWPTMSSDLVRKELAGVAAAERAGPAHYTAEFSLEPRRQQRQRHQCGRRHAADAAVCPMPGRPGASVAGRRGRAVSCGAPFCRVDPMSVTRQEWHAFIDRVSHGLSDC